MFLGFRIYNESRSRAATTGNIEIIAASQAKQVKIVVMGAEETGKTGKNYSLIYRLLISLNVNLLCVIAYH